MATAAAQPQKPPTKWSELPEDLVVMIGERFSMYADSIRFRSVCMPWYSALKNHHHHPSAQLQNFPFLLLPCEDDDDEDSIDTCSRGLLSLPENNKMYHLRGLPKKPFKNMYCPGSSHGWLVIVDDDDDDNPSMNLINPFTRAQLPQLPPMKTFRDMLPYQPYTVGPEYNYCPDLYKANAEEHNIPVPANVIKVVLSSSPSSSSLKMSSSSSSSSSQFQQTCSDVVAIAILGLPPGMAVSRPGDKAWILFSSYTYQFTDVICCRDDLLYALGVRYFNNEWGSGEYTDYEIVVIHMDMDMEDNPLPKIVDTIKKPQGVNCAGNYSTCYLVESCGDLLLVERDIVAPPFDGEEPEFEFEFEFEFGYKTIGFKVYKLLSDYNKSSSSSSSSNSWVEMNNLGDRMLFLGVNSSFSLSSHDFPGSRGNCIYFTNHYFFYADCYTQQNCDFDDMGVFNLEDQRIEPLPLKDFPSFRGHSMGRRWPPPIWLTPNPN